MRPLLLSVVCACVSLSAGSSLRATQAAASTVQYVSAADVQRSQPQTFHTLGAQHAPQGLRDIFNGSAIDGHALPEWFGVVFNGMLIGIGLLEVTAGYRLFRYTLMLLGSIAGGVPVFLLTWDNIEGPNAFWFGVGTGAMAGLICAAASWFLWKVGVWLIGASLGVVIALVLNITILYKVSLGDPNTPLEIAAVLLGLLFGYIALKIMRLTMIVSTSVIGAYAAIRGIGHFAGGYPDEFTIGEDLAEGHTDTLPWTVYAYGGAWVVLWIIGFIVQFRITARKTGEGKDDNERAFEESADILDVVTGKNKKKKKKSKDGETSSGGKKKSKGKAGSKAAKPSAKAAKYSSKTESLLSAYEGGDAGDDGGYGYDTEAVVPGGYDDGDDAYYPGPGTTGGGAYALGAEEEDYGYAAAKAGGKSSGGGRKGMFGGFGGGGKKQPASVNW